MGRRRTTAERNQDRKLAFMPMWPLVGIMVVIAIVVFVGTR
ncbi:MAG: hypothetical protein JWN35_2540 [Frankiales bacterium]|jgi:type VI protein secretion system component VasF|nr:hypothetical protein [Frankiales bacterium]